MYVIILLTCFYVCYILLIYILTYINLLLDILQQQSFVIGEHQPLTNIKSFKSE